MNLKKMYVVLAVIFLLITIVVTEVERQKMNDNPAFDMDFESGLQIAFVLFPFSILIALPWVLAIEYLDKQSPLYMKRVNLVICVYTIACMAVTAYLTREAGSVLMVLPYFVATIVLVNIHISKRQMI